MTSAGLVGCSIREDELMTECRIAGHYALRRMCC